MGIEHSTFWSLTVIVLTKALVDGTYKEVPGLIWVFLVLFRLKESLMMAAKYCHVVVD
jgi:hypothetical protein